MTPIPEGSKWRAIQMYEAMVAEDRQKAQEEKRAAEKKRLYESLNSQVSAHETAKQEAIRCEKEYGDAVYTDVKKFREEKVAVVERKLALNNSLLTTWEKQVVSINATIWHTFITAFGMLWL
jgi:hypothetical protein